MLRSSIILLITLTSTVFDAFFPGKPDEATKEFFTLQAVVKFMDRVHYSVLSMINFLNMFIIPTLNRLIHHAGF